MGRLKHPKMVDIKDILDENTRLPSLVAASAEKLLGLERLNRAYDKIVRDKESGSPENFFQLAARHLNLKLQLRPGDLENIPKKGPVVVVANHPHGLSDGIMFGELLTRVREDVRILANEQLSLCQELEPWLIKVDVYEDENAKRKNLSGMRKMIAWLRKGGVLYCAARYPEQLSGLQDYLQHLRGLGLGENDYRWLEPAELAERFLGEADVVLAEGFSHAAGEKIEVLRRA